MNEQLEPLRACWNKLTGQDLNARATERLFFEYLKMDFTESDLQCVLRACLAYNRKHQTCPMKIQVHKIIGDLEIFASMLGEARAKERNQVKAATPKEQVLQAFRPVVNPELSGTGNTHHISEFIKVPK